MATVFQESSFLPVAEQVRWERELFLLGAERIADAHKFPSWKKSEIAATLEVIFETAIAEGKNFDDAVLMVDESVKRAVNR